MAQDRQDECPHVLGVDAEATVEGGSGFGPQDQGLAGTRSRPEA
ncbi:MAG: hypothetical protein RL385_6065, partial [Pseudomonadota bacterium]